MAFRELYKIKFFLKDKNLRLRIVLIDVEESRLLHGWSKDRKKGSVRHDRIPVELVDEFLIQRVEDYRMFLPPELGEQFLAKEYALATKLPLSHAQTALHIMNYLNVVERVGKKGNAYIYRMVE